MNRHNVYILISISIILTCLAVLTERTIEPPGSQQQKDIDYSSYFYKVWVTENNGLFYISSFYMNSIKDGLIDGNLLGGIDVRRLEPTYSYEKFSGYIIDNTAQCQFYAPYSFFYEADFKFYFTAPNRILMQVEDSSYEREIGYYLFRPYNADDLHRQYDYEKTKFFPVDFDYAEDVSIMASLWKNEYIDSHPMIYLVNKDEDIYYFFDFPFPNNWEVAAADAKDVNGDGIKDLVLTMQFLNTNIYIERIFIQTEDGEFHYADEQPEN